MSSVIEPPIDVEERPYTIILAEDGLYQDGLSVSWHSSFAQVFPPKFGLSYQHFSLPPPPNPLPTDVDEYSWVDQVLTEISLNVQTLPDAIWVARGPIQCHLAQLVLERSAFRGLVLVDPMDFASTDCVRAMEQYLKQQQRQRDRIEPSQQRNEDRPAHNLWDCVLFEEITNHWDHWTLKVEPGAVPMLILQTSSLARVMGHDNSTTIDSLVSLCRTSAVSVAARHGDPMGPMGDVAVVSMDQETTDATIMAILSRWLDESVR